MLINLPKTNSPLPTGRTKLAMKATSEVAKSNELIKGAQLNEKLGNAKALALEEKIKIMTQGRLSLKIIIHN